MEVGDGCGLIVHSRLVYKGLGVAERLSKVHSLQELKGAMRTDRSNGIGYMAWDQSTSHDIPDRHRRLRWDTSVVSQALKLAVVRGR